MSSQLQTLSESQVVVSESIVDIVNKVEMSVQDVKKQKAEEAKAAKEAEKKQKAEEAKAAKEAEKKQKAEEAKAA